MLSRVEYHAYLESDHWKAFRERYAAEGKLQECFVCGNQQYELHHRTYDRLGNELIEDVVPLCDEHHRKTHRVAKSGRSLYDAHIYVKMRYQRGDNLDIRTLKTE